jgi:hypothetical protein
MEKIKNSFPSLSAGFYDILCDRLKANNFTDEKLQNAVNHVIDTCIYPIPTIANFISFNKIDAFQLSEEDKNEYAELKKKIYGK